MGRNGEENMRKKKEVNYISVIDQPRGLVFRVSAY